MERKYFNVKDPKNVQEFNTMSLVTNIDWMREGLKLNDNINKLNINYISDQNNEI